MPKEKRTENKKSVVIGVHNCNDDQGLSSSGRNFIKQQRQPTATNYNEHVLKDTISKEEQPYDIPEGWVR